MTTVIPYHFAQDTAMTAQEKKYYFAESTSKEGKHIKWYQHFKAERTDLNGALISVVFFALSFFVGLVYSCRSLKEAYDYDQQKEISEKGVQENTSVKTLFDQTDHLDSSKAQNRRMFEDAALVWKKMRNERITACVCQVLMTLGAAILTAWVALAFTSYGTLPFLKPVAFGGCGCIGVGLSGYLAKKLFLSFDKEKDACTRLLNYPNSYN